MNINVSDYAYVENPRTVFVIEWTGANWDELIRFFRAFTRGWEASVWSTDQKSIEITGLQGGERLIVERWDHLLVEPGGRTGKVIGEVDLISGYTKGRPNS